MTKQEDLLESTSALFHDLCTDKQFVVLELPKGFVMDLEHDSRLLGVSKSKLAYVLMMQGDE